MAEHEYPKHLNACVTLAKPLTLPCGLTLPNRLVKCPMQETLAKAPSYDPPIEEFKNLYGQWSAANYGLIITGMCFKFLSYLVVGNSLLMTVHIGQVQIDIRCKRPL